MKTLSSIFLSLFFLSCFSGEAQERDVPRKGEGIYAFLRRHNCLDTPCYDEFIKLNRGKFGKDNSLLLNVSYQLPSVKTDGNTNKTKAKEPLFGKQYEDYEVEDQILAGACYFLVSGHGGPDPGTTYNVDGKELHEDEYAYDIMLRLARNLLMHGAKVHIIIQDSKDGIRDDYYLANSKRETCMGKAIPLEQAPRLKQRSDKINQLSAKTKEKYQRAVFIHMDSRGKSKQTDIFFYYTKDNRSKRMAQTIRDTFQSQYQKHQPGRGFSGTVSYRDLHVLRESKPVSVYVEVGNIQNPFDQKRFMQNDNRQALANWFLKAFIEDYQEDKKIRS
jgi:N-acetylmuramoyl-L-alanine amidase